MFESAEIGHKLSREEFKAREPDLRGRLLDAQFDIWDGKKFPVVISLCGLAAAGKGEIAAKLTEWMDPRRIDVYAMAERSDEERERPRMWRYWRALPPKGRIGIYFNSWYAEAVTACAEGGIDRAELDERLAAIRRFERMLADEGALVLKFWLHLPRKAQKKRLKELEGDKRTSWRATAADWREAKNYKAVVKEWGHAVRTTNLAHAPWHIVEATDKHFAYLSVGEAIAQALRGRLDAPRPPALPDGPLPAAAIDGKGLLDTLDLAGRVDEAEYEARLEELQGRLARLSRRGRFKKRGAVVVFEGQDAAGKGGAIKRVAEALDPRFYKIIPIAAPTDEERAHPYLWRFWRHLPGRGHFTVYDRSWYGRVLVERVEGFAKQDEWLRAYGEINDFEDDLARHGIVLTKFWLAISADEQLRRFKEREATGFKRYKIGPEDYRNREKWDAYVRAANDMFERTSTSAAPWTVVAAQDKYHARLTVLKTLCERIEEALDG